MPVTDYMLGTVLAMKKFSANFSNSKSHEGKDPLGHTIEQAITWRQKAQCYQLEKSETRGEELPKRWCDESSPWDCLGLLRSELLLCLCWVFLPSAWDDHFGITCTIRSRKRDSLLHLLKTPTSLINQPAPVQ